MHNRRQWRHRASSQKIEQLKRTIKQDYPWLADAPLFVTSAQTGAGIAELQAYLKDLPNLADSDKPFRCTVDRIFSVKGAGTVVTGTAFDGR